MDNMKKWLRIQDEDEEQPDQEQDQGPSILEQVGIKTKLSMKQRMYGFGICIGIGLLCMIISIVMLGFVRLAAFGIFYSLGNITSILSTGFLIGPVKQIKNMVKPHRLIATIVFICSIVLTLMAALWWKKVALCVIFMIIQFCAYFWYCLSYIPYGREMCQKCLGSATNMV